MVEDEAVVFWKVDIEEERGRLDDVHGDARLHGQTLVTPEAVAAEGEGYGLGRLQHQRIGAPVTARGNDDLRGAAAGGGHLRVHLRLSGWAYRWAESELWLRRVRGGVAGSLGQGRVELQFGLGFNPAARRWRRTIRCRSAADGGRRRAWLTLFGQHMAARPFSHGQRVPVAADDNDLRVNVRQVDCRQRTREQFAIEGVPFLGRDIAGQTAFALTEGLDGNDRPQARPVTRVIRHFRAGAHLQCSRRFASSG